MKTIDWRFRLAQLAATGVLACLSGCISVRRDVEPATTTTTTTTTRAPALVPATTTTVERTTY